MKYLDYLKEKITLPHIAYQHLIMKSMLDSEITMSEDFFNKNSLNSVLELHLGFKTIFQDYFDINSINLNNKKNLFMDISARFKKLITIEKLKDEEFVDNVFTLMSLDKKDLISLYSTIILIQNQSKTWEDVESWLENNNITEIDENNSNQNVKLVHKKLITKYNFSFLATSNIFDINKINTFAENAFNEISKSLEMPSHMIGMNQIGLSYNLMSDYTAICPTNYFCALKFDNLTTAHIATGHEWIHAMDALMAKTYDENLDFISLIKDSSSPYPHVDKLVKQMNRSHPVNVENVKEFKKYLSQYSEKFLEENVSKNVEMKNYILSSKLHKGIEQLLNNCPASLNKFQKEIDPYWNPLAPEARKALIYNEFLMYHSLQSLKNYSHEKLIKEKIDTNLFLTFAKKADADVYKLYEDFGENYVSNKIELLARSFESFLDSQNNPSYASNISKTNFYVPQGLDRNQQKSLWKNFSKDVKLLHQKLNPSEIIQKVKMKRQANARKEKVNRDEENFKI